jgi:hypothetical protein
MPPFPVTTSVSSYYPVLRTVSRENFFLSEFIFAFLFWRREISYFVHGHCCACCHQLPSCRSTMASNTTRSSITNVSNMQGDSDNLEFNENESVLGGNDKENSRKSQRNAKKRVVHSDDEPAVPVVAKRSKSKTQSRKKQATNQSELEAALEDANASIASLQDALVEANASL